MFDRLISTAGFPWTIRAMGFIALAAALLSFPTLLSGSSVVAGPRKARRLFDRSALKDRLFLIFTACLFTNFLSYAVPYFYIPTYTKEKLGTSDSTALYMLVIAVAASFFGRLGSGVLAHFGGSTLTWGFCAGASGVLSLAWTGIETENGFIVFSILWGEQSATFLRSDRCPTVFCMS